MDLQKVYREKQQMLGNTAQEELERLRSEVAGLQKEAVSLQEVISNLEKKNALLTEAGRKLLAENQRIKRKLEEDTNDRPKNPIESEERRAKNSELHIFKIITIIESFGSDPLVFQRAFLYAILIEGYTNVER